jgi:hypothetical protein
MSTLKTQIRSLFIANLHSESGWCVAYAIAGRVDIDFETEPLATVDGKVSMIKLLSLIQFFYLFK